jgi:hypothetical protein
MKRSMERLRAEFLEMPCPHLSLQQIRRFCGLEEAECSAAIDFLEAKFLCRKANGTYARRTDDPVAYRFRATRGIADGLEIAS